MWIFCYYSFKTPLTAERLTFGEHFLFLIYNGQKWHSRQPFPAIVTYCQKKKTMLSDNLTQVFISLYMPQEKFDR